MSALLDSAIAQIGHLHDGPDVVRMAREIGEKFPRLAKYCATAKPDTPWCGIFIAWLLAIYFGIEPPYDPNDDTGSFMHVDGWAKTNWGGTRIQPGQEQPGDILPLRVPHHVTILKEVRGDRYICVGGNQTGPSGNPDSVTESTYARSGLMAIIRPPALAGSVAAAPVVVAPLDQRTIDAIVTAAGASDLARYKWADRGLAPRGYTKGMAVSFAMAWRKLAARDSAALAMVRFVDGGGDVFDHYEAQFRAAGIVTAEAPDIDRLRALFVVLTGLGMRESSGNYSEGRDMSASNVEADTAEAGLFQQSWDSHGTSPEIRKLFDAYRTDRYQSLVEIFREGVRVKDTSISGDGDGATFQRLARTKPAFAVEVAAIGLRTLFTHWGPIKERAAEVRPEADALFRQVQEIVAAAPATQGVPVAEPIEQKPAPVPVPDTHPEIKLGATGPAVAELQKLLGLPTTGFFDFPTEQAVRSYQAAHGLDVDGEVGTDTWDMLLGKTLVKLPTTVITPSSINTGRFVDFILAHREEARSLISLGLTVYNSRHPDHAIALPTLPAPAPAQPSVLTNPSVRIGLGGGLATVFAWLTGAVTPDMGALLGAAAAGVATLGATGVFGPLGKFASTAYQLWKTTSQPTK